MKIVKNFILYIGLFIVFGGLIFYLLHKGRSLDHSVTTISSVANEPSTSGGIFTNIFQSNLQELQRNCGLTRPRVAFDEIEMVAGEAAT